MNEKTLPILHIGATFVSGSQHTRKERNNFGKAGATFARCTVTRAISRIRGHNPVAAGRPPRSCGHGLECRLGACQFEVAPYSIQYEVSS
jgi:hypothetical protein